jgi:hypothetical protein
MPEDDEQPFVKHEPPPNPGAPPPVSGAATRSRNEFAALKIL